MDGQSALRAAIPVDGRLPLVLLGVTALVLVALTLVLAPATALAGRASSGELFFYPCDSCHPVTIGANGEPLAGTLPIEFAGHEIVLEGHDQLGIGDAACLACHDDPASDPGMLKLADGSLVEITGDTAAVCYRCHSEKYEEWEAGTHGRGQPACTSAGCHDPHTPSYIFADALLPFVGSGFQFKALGGREPFTPYAPPAPAPDVETPDGFVIVVVVGVLAALLQAGSLAAGRLKR